MGAIYTPKEISTYLCRNTIFPFILDRVNGEFRTHFDYQGDLEKVLDQLNQQHLQYIFTIAKEIRILDPAVGTGHFLLEALATLEDLYDYLVNNRICDWKKNQIKKWIITHNLFGVDISDSAVKECKTRLTNTLVKASKSVAHSQILPELNLHIKRGNSLIGCILNEVQPQKNEENNLDPFHWKHEFPDVVREKGFDLCLGNPPWNILKPVEKEFFSQYDPRLTKYGVDKKEAKQIITDLLKQEAIRNQWEEYKSSIHLAGIYFRGNEYSYQSDKIEGVNTKRTVSGDLNLYKLFLERVYRLTKPGGYCGVIIPSGFHTDAGTKGLRRLLFEENEVREIYSFENRKGIFPTIHRSFKFDLLIFRKARKRTKKFRAAFMLHDPIILEKISKVALSLNWEVIKLLSPSSWSVLEFKTEKDITIASQMYQHPTLQSDVQGSWQVRFTRELDMSLDSNLFNIEQQGLTIFEGKMIEQYNYQFKEPRYWIKKINILSKFGKKYKEFEEHRIGFRAVAASTNRRTMIATILPCMVCCGNSVIVTRIVNPENSEKMIDEDDLLYLCGVFNSFVFDYLLRMKVTTNINMFFVYDMPVPRLSKHNKIYQEIIKNVANLYPEFEAIHKRVKQNISIQSPLNRLQCEATIDSLVAKLYGLDEKSFEYILDQFHLKDPKKEKILSIEKSAILARFRK